MLCIFVTLLLFLYSYGNFTVVHFVEAITCSISLSEIVVVLSF